MAATAARGLHAEVATIGSLPYPDASFDVVVAAWMLYHVPDLDAALAEVRRVLRPGGSFVAVTNGDRHLARLLEDAGGVAFITQFSSENGEEALRRYFARVTATHIATTACFSDHADAVAYLETVDESLAHGLAWFDGPRGRPGPRRSSTLAERPPTPTSAGTPGLRIPTPAPPSPTLPATVVRVGPWYVGGSPEQPWR